MPPVCHHWWVAATQRWICRFHFCFDLSVGYLDDEPICDLCLLERFTDLGLMLAVVAVVRAYAGGGGTPEQHREALEELGTFARIYHRVASESWPARIFRIPGFTARDDTMPL